MRPITVSLSPSVLDADGVAASQTPAGAGAVTINGALATGGVATFASPQIVTIYSGSNISNRTFDVTGLDRDGNTISQTSITGPNNSTVATTKYFKEVTGVTISGAAAGAITVGVNGLGTSQIIPLDVYPRANISVAVTAVTGATYKLQYTYDDVQATTWPNGTQTWFDHATMVSKTDTADATINNPVTAVRFVITTAASPQSLTGRIIQSGGMV